MELALALSGLNELHMTTDPATCVKLSYLHIGLDEKRCQAGVARWIFDCRLSIVDCLCSSEPLEAVEAVRVEMTNSLSGRQKDQVPNDPHLHTTSTTTILSRHNKYWRGRSISESVLMKSDFISGNSPLSNY